MKKQVKIIIGVVVVIAVAIAVASYFFPRPAGEDASGTIGKADKYRRAQLTERDILLRDDILEDTAAVGKTLKVMIEFSVYAAETKMLVDNAWIKPLQKNCSDAECKEIIAVLQDYSDFVGNNFGLLKSTTDLLGKCYFSGTKEISEDVGSQLISYVNFIDQFLRRDTAFDHAITALNHYIDKGTSVDARRRQQIEALKLIRDQMVVDNLLVGINTGDQEKINFIAGLPISNVGVAVELSNITTIGAQGIPASVASLVIGNSVIGSGFIGSFNSAAVCSSALPSILSVAPGAASAAVSSAISSQVGAAANKPTANVASQVGVVASSQTAANVAGQVGVAANVPYQSIFNSGFLNAVNSQGDLGVYQGQPLSSILGPISAAEGAPASIVLNIFNSAALTNTILNGPLVIGFLSPIASVEQ
ncbi:MAG TPA: hypothetical protein P5531_14095 [Bacteroidales bacterium]|nr:hypothetical protein [Bacteroidales bacterium]HSA44720.1 hypothetical protein [Bacteroidales bacterium]